jgi:hypothetical protein
MNPLSKALLGLAVEAIETAAEKLRARRARIKANSPKPWGPSTHDWHRNLDPVVCARCEQYLTPANENAPCPGPP